MRQPQPCRAGFVLLSILGVLLVLSIVTPLVFFAVWYAAYCG